MYMKKKIQSGNKPKKPLMYVCLIDVKNPSKNRVENQMEYPPVCPYVCMTGRQVVRSSDSRGLEIDREYSPATSHVLAPKLKV